MTDSTMPQSGAISPAAPPPLPAGGAAAVIPYATPMGYQDAYAWREGDLLIVRSGAVLPPACIKCNAPADGAPMRRTLYWHHPAVFLLIFAGVLIYAIAALIIRQKGVVSVSLCAAHRQRRLMMMLVGWALGLGGVATFIFGAANDLPWLFLAGAVLFIAGVVVGVNSQLLRPKKIDKYFIWLKNISPDFLAQFPAVIR
jgi:hypothetical protein